jgi:hypothetical protein
MKKLLIYLTKGGGKIVIPDTTTPRYFEIYVMDDGSLVVRQSNTGLISQSEKPTAAGLLRLLKWIDDDTAH